MKDMKHLLLLAVALFIVGGVAGVLIAKRQAARSAASPVGEAEASLAQAKREVQSAKAPAEPPASPATHEAIVPTEKPQPLQPKKASGQTHSPPQKTAAQPQQGVRPVKEPLKDPAARIALAWVGADAEAESYWYDAINDPTLPPNERQDLIEDLNEDGLSDPKHPTADDLPLIVRRLMIIDAVGPDAMDEVNADAFQEAYKDLVNLANLAMGGGEPVR